MRIETKLLGATVAATLLIAVSAAAQTPPPPTPIPDFQLPGQVVRFGLTVHGSQLDDIAFKWEPSPGATCPLFAQGTLKEFWQFRRGKSVVIEFQKLAGRVLLRRKGRQLGDSAFAAPGSVERVATGFLQGPAGNACPTFPFDRTDCNQEMPVNSDLRLDYTKGALRLKQSGPAVQNKNPAENCGSAVAPAVNFGGELSDPYPFMSEQRAGLTRDRIFKSGKNIKLTLKDKFLAPTEGTSGFTEFTEHLSGTTVVTLKRL